MSCVLLPLCFPVTFLPATSSHQALSEHPSAQTMSMMELRGDRGQGKYLWGLWFWSIRWSWRYICNLTVAVTRIPCGNGMGPGMPGPCWGWPGCQRGLKKHCQSTRMVKNCHELDQQSAPRNPDSIDPFITPTPLGLWCELRIEVSLWDACGWFRGSLYLLESCVQRWTRALSVLLLMAQRIVAHWWENQGHWIKLTTETEPWKGCGSLNIWFTWENLCCRCCRCYMLAHVSFRGVWTLRFREGKPTEDYKHINNGTWKSGCSVLEEIFEVFCIFQIYFLYLIS